MDYTSGHCFFEAVSVSYALTCGMSETQGAHLVRALYSFTYGSSTSTLLPLLNCIDGQMRDRYHEYLARTERQQQIQTQQWVWGAGGLFSARSQMMRSLDCRKVTADIWEYNIGLDSDVLPLITTRALAVCGVNIETGEEFFHLHGIRLDVKEASHRAHLAIAMAGKF
jgi:hypothetical protein